MIALFFCELDSKCKTSAKKQWQLRECVADCYRIVMVRGGDTDGFLGVLPVRLEQFV